MLASVSTVCGAGSLATTPGLAATVHESHAPWIPGPPDAAGSGRGEQLDIDKLVWLCSCEHGPHHCDWQGDVPQVSPHEIKARSVLIDLGWHRWIQ